MRRLLLLVFFAGCGSFGEADEADEATTPAPNPSGDGGTTPDGGGLTDADASSPSKDAGDERPHDRVVFVTSMQFYPDELQGYAGASAKCTAAADASQLLRVKGHKFLAWIGDGLDDPLGRFTQSTMPYVRPKGGVIAQNWAGLTQSPHLAAISEDENGMEVTTADIWTGVNAIGSSTETHCGGWTDRFAPQGTTGKVSALDATWTDEKTGSCNTNHRIYCFEE